MGWGGGDPRQHIKPHEKPTTQAASRPPAANDMTWKCPHSVAVVLFSSCACRPVLATAAPFVTCTTRTGLETPLTGHFVRQMQMQVNEGCVQDMDRNKIPDSLPETTGPCAYSVHCV